MFFKMSNFVALFILDVILDERNYKDSFFA